MYSKNGFQHKVSDGTGLSDDLVCVCVSVCVCVVLPKKSADAGPVTESLACSGHTGRHRWPCREIQQDSRKKHSNRSQLCRSTAPQIKETYVHVIYFHR